MSPQFMSPHGTRACAHTCHAHIRRDMHPTNAQTQAHIEAYVASVNTRRTHPAPRLRTPSVGAGHVGRHWCTPCGQTAGMTVCACLATSTQLQGHTRGLFDGAASRGSIQALACCQCCSPTCCCTCQRDRARERGGGGRLRPHHPFVPRACVSLTSVHAL